jgi:putative sensory transduction regulator
MTDELITPENLSKEMIKATLDAAMMDTSYDSDGDILVKDIINVWVLPNAERKDRIKLLSIFGFEPGASRLDRLECVNKINSEYIVVKAFVGQKDTIRFDYDILVAGGITKKAFILALKRFCSIPRPAAAEHGTGVIK